jgi:putative component of membrane protein insertase Oxa1/YidC/SpoIIIJ protein YidD
MREHFRRKILVFLTGVFLLVSFCRADGPGLAAELFAEKDWEPCLRECERLLITDPHDDDALLFSSVCKLRLGRDTRRARTDLGGLMTSKADLSIRTRAAYEKARADWKDGDMKSAFEAFLFAFYRTGDPTLFVKSACSLTRVMDDVPDLSDKQKHSLRMQINSSRDLWYGPLFKECRVDDPAKKTPALAYPARWFTLLYRAQIGPAIGDRCVLEPSCSAYFLEAGRKHGLLAFPMIADRFFREPSEAQDPGNRIVKHGRVRHADPVSDHDGWMGKGSEDKARRAK